MDSLSATPTSRAAAAAVEVVEDADVAAAAAVEDADVAAAVVVVADAGAAATSHTTD